MTSIGATSSYSIRYQDRAAYAQLLAENSEGRFTAEEIAKRNDESDLQVLKSLESIAAIARGEGILTGISRGNTTVTLNMRSQPDPELYTRQFGKIPGGRPTALNAFDVNFVVENQEKIYGHDLKNMAYYAEYLQNTMSTVLQDDPNYVFNGSWGTDRVTHDVNEYIGWLYERAGIDRPAATTDIKDGFTPQIEGVIDYDPAVIKKAMRMLDAAANSDGKSVLLKLDGETTDQEEQADPAQPETAADKAVKIPTLDELKSQIINALTSGSSSGLLLDSARQLLQQSHGSEDRGAESGELRRWA